MTTYDTAKYAHGATHAPGGPADLASYYLPNGAPTHDAPGLGLYFPEAHGAVGDGTHDDTSAWNAAAAAAIAANGTLWTDPDKTYVLSDTITLNPASGSQTFLDIKSGGLSTNIKWTGATNNASVFKVAGWKNSLVSGVKVELTTSATGIAVWDIITTSTSESTSGVTFKNCHVNLGTADSCVAWRMGHTASGSLNDISFYQWENCVAYGDPAGAHTNTVGWLNEGSNSLNHVWLGGFGAFLGAMVSNETTGNAALYFYGLGGSQNLIDFQTRSDETISINGGRFELGNRFLDTNQNAATPNISVRDVEIDEYAPSDGIIFSMHSPGVLKLDNCRVIASTDYTNPIIDLNGIISGSGSASLIIDGGLFSKSDNLYANNNVPWTVKIRGAQYVTGGSRTPTAHIPDVPERSVLTNPSSNTFTPDINAGRAFLMPVSSTSTQTIANPTGTPVGGEVITFLVNNQTGTTMGSVAFGSNYRIAGSFTSPANTKSRTITFQYFTTFNKWFEVSRCTADL